MGISKARSRNFEATVVRYCNCLNSSDRNTHFAGRVFWEPTGCFVWRKTIFIRKINVFFILVSDMGALVNENCSVVDQNLIHRDRPRRPGQMSPLVFLSKPECHGTPQKIGNESGVSFLTAGARFLAAKTQDYRTRKS